ncbi:MAG TPA: CmcJ/NvfI family oxidoreductase [Burkholderiales bacterium]|nr:CmcJ/NvfI family oxidoreductase [Burkholderiales bacterium]
MNDTALPATRAAASIAARLAYLHETVLRPFAYAYEPPDGGDWENYGQDWRETWITDARCFPKPTRIDVEGFELWSAPSDVRDFSDADAIRDVYYKEAAELACAATRGTRAYVFDHLVRRREEGRPQLGFGRRRGQGMHVGANGQVHNDYTEASGLNRLSTVIPDARQAQAAGGFSIVNIWRPVVNPVFDTPLALCDARTVSARDLVAADVHYPTRTGEIYLLRHSPRHRWCYFHAMEPHEVLIFKQYDSRLSGVARFVPHCAFDHPYPPRNAPARQSIEVRCLVVHEVQSDTLPADD